MKNIIVLIIILILLFSSSTVSKAMQLGIELGKSYSNRVICNAADTKNVIQRTNIAINYLFPQSAIYTIGAKLSFAIDDDIIGSVSSPTYGDIITGLYIVNEFKSTIGHFNPTFQVGTGIIGNYYTLKGAGCAQALSAAIWPDIFLGTKHSLFLVGNREFYFDLKFERSFNYFFVNQKTIPISYSIGVFFLVS